MSKKDMLKLAKELNRFIDASPTASHCVSETEKKLLENGFKRLYEKDVWKLKNGDKFFVIRHESALIAGIYGKKNLKEFGFRIIGSHTDSPSFKLKPKAAFIKDGYIQLSTEVYGGPLYASWLDRELSLAGNVVVKKGKSYEIKLIDLEKPVLIIPQLAIHYNRDVNEAFKLNPQENLVPIMGLSEKTVNDDYIKDIIAEKLKIKASEIINYDLELYAVQKGNICGFENDFIMNRGLDDKSMVHASLQALLEVTPSDSTMIIALYDNEEVGSSTTNGGKSSFTCDVLERLTNFNREDCLRAIDRSYFISADGAHAIHPNYSLKFDKLNKVYLNKGPVIKINANTSYATTTESSAVFEMICTAKKIPYQKFVNRSDVRGGGTIGSMIANNLGIRTVDIGNAMLAMHSVRETAGVKDHYWMKEAMKGFLEY
ncbi:MAG: M18 family aminopeptidase [Candidatus Delongbacteria bacterium]|nr:M18 family aminopeptidase [Candidatus Delongbacteria bacterium]MCG2760571.1 M18 family aminopeptidase [Candidatus Delongbacteria bacterium]